MRPRNRVVDHAEYIAPTPQNEVDHTYHTDHTSQEYICPETSKSSSGDR